MEEEAGAHSYAHTYQSHSLKLVEISRATLYLAGHASLKSQQGNLGFWNASPICSPAEACLHWLAFADELVSLPTSTLSDLTHIGCLESVLVLVFLPQISKHNKSR